MAPKILLIDDSPPVLEALDFVLSKNDYFISTSVNGLDALEKIKKENFDIIVSDVEMPIMNGTELGVELRKFNRHTPIIFFSAYGKFSYEDLDKFSKIDNKFLITEKDLPSLLNLIESLLAR